MLAIAAQYVGWSVGILSFVVFFVIAISPMFLGGQKQF